MKAHRNARQQRAHFKRLNWLCLYGGPVGLLMTREQARRLKRTRARMRAAEGARPPTPWWGEVA